MGAKSSKQVRPDPEAAKRAQEREQALADARMLRERARELQETTIEGSEIVGSVNISDQLAHSSHKGDLLSGEASSAADENADKHMVRHAPLQLHKVKKRDRRSFMGTKRLSGSKIAEVSTKVDAAATPPPHADGSVSHTSTVTDSQAGSNVAAGAESGAASEGANSSISGMTSGAATSAASSTANSAVSSSGSPPAAEDPLPGSLSTARVPEPLSRAARAVRLLVVRLRTGRFRTGHLRAFARGAFARGAFALGCCSVADPLDRIALRRDALCCGDGGG